LILTRCDEPCCFNENLNWFDPMFYWMSCVKLAILQQYIIHIHPCLFFFSRLDALLIAFFPWNQNRNHCNHKERTRFTAPLPNVCQSWSDEWNSGGARADEGQHGGHERANDHNDGSHDEYEKNDGGQHDNSCFHKYHHRIRPDSPTWLQSSKLSSLRYGRLRRQSIGKYGWPLFCAGPEQGFPPTICLASQLYTTQCCTHSRWECQQLCSPTHWEPTSSIWSCTGLLTHGGDT